MHLRTPRRLPSGPERAMSTTTRDVHDDRAAPPLDPHGRQLPVPVRFPPARGAALPRPGWGRAPRSARPGTAEGAQSVSTGVCQSRHSARFPDFAPETRNTSGGDPELSRNAWIDRVSGPFHSAREAQWVPSWTSET